MFLKLIRLLSVLLVQKSFLQKTRNLKMEKSTNLNEAKYIEGLD
jgi:hypothetical protein